MFELLDPTMDKSLHLHRQLPIFSDNLPLEYHKSTALLHLVIEGAVEFGKDQVQRMKQRVQCHSLMTD